MCSFHEYLSPYRKWLKTDKPFSRKTIFKIRAFWLVESVFGHNSRNNFFLNLKKFTKISTINTLRLRPFWAKTNDTIFLKKSKTLILGIFWWIWAESDFFFENRALSLFFIFDPLTSCKKAKKSNEPFSLTCATINYNNNYYRL